MRKITRFLVSVFLLGALLAADHARAQFTEQRLWGGTTGGSANAQTLTIANWPATPVTGVPVCGIAGFSNTTAATLAISGPGGSSGTKNIFKPSAGGAVALTGGEIIAGQVTCFFYDGTEYQLSANNAQNAAFITTPQGYLTPCQVSAGSPVSGCTAGQLMPTGDVSAATVLYYEPAFGNQAPIYNGSNMVMTQFGELTLTIPSSRLANTLYDVCLFLNTGTPTLAFSVAWTTSTIASGARGTGAGTAQIAQVQGIWTNAVAITGAVNGASSFNISANQCTVVATAWIDGTNGQVSFNRTFGSNRKWSVDNFYNGQDIMLQAGDATASWTYASATWRQSNGGAGNNLKIVSGLPKAPTLFQFIQQMRTDATSNGCVQQIAVGWNSTTAPIGMSGQGGFSNGGGTTLSSYSTATGTYIALPTIGVNQANSLEATPSFGGTCTFYGSSSGMLLRGTWKG